MSKHTGEKCGKLCISGILSPKRSITATKIDVNKPLELNLKYSKTKSDVKFQLDMSKHVREKCMILYAMYFQYSKV